MSDIELEHDTELAVEFSDEVRELCDEYHGRGLPRAVIGMLLGFEENHQKGQAEQDDLIGPLYALSTEVFRAAKESKEEHDIPSMQVYAEVREVAECFRRLERERSDTDTDRSGGASDAE